MTIKPKARKFRIKRSSPFLGSQATAVKITDDDEDDDETGVTGPAASESTGEAPASAPMPPAAAHPAASQPAAGTGSAQQGPSARLKAVASGAAAPDSRAESRAESRPQSGPEAAPETKPEATPETGPRTAAESAPETGPTLRGDVDSPATVASQTDMDAIRKEGLTGRQLRMARRVAQKHGLAVTSDFDAVRQLRANGIDPFQRSNILELVLPDSDNGGGVPQVGPGDGRIQLPQTMPQPGKNLPSTEQIPAAERRASEIMKIQKDMARRRRRASIALAVRLFLFVLVPTFMAGYYYYFIATPMYETKTEFVIQNAQAPAAAAGLGGLFAGTGLATNQDSITVQAFLTSREAMMELDKDHGFKAHFSQDWIDPIQRLPRDATNEQAFKLYSKMVKISYDPTEGILKMDVIAADPKTSQQFSEALVHYAEEQVDKLTQRLRADQMAGAQASYEAAEARRIDALNKLLEVQNNAAVLDPVGESASVMQQITTLETRRSQKMLELSTLQSAARPNAARVNGVQQEIQGYDDLIGQLREQLTTTDGNPDTLASKSTDLRLAQENYQFQTVMVQQAQSMMEVARTEANRQVRYLSMGVSPVAPDQPTYPRSFENTILAFLILSGIYLMISLTASILREQVTG